MPACCAQDDSEAASQHGSAQQNVMELLLRGKLEDGSRTGGPDHCVHGLACTRACVRACVRAAQRVPS